jgi:hypothetical protein
MLKKIKFLPLKSNQAKAYAAKTARVSGKIAAGRVIAKLLKKYWLSGGVTELPWKSVLS